MSEIDRNGLDQAVATFLMGPDSCKALKIMREARKIEFLTDSDDIRELARDHKQDCRQLHDATLTLESDPEIVKRNMAARVISGFFPILNSIEEVGTMEDRSWKELLINGMGILSEIATSTQYLEATKLSTWSNNERSLVIIEERLFRMAGMYGDVMSAGVLIEGFMDDIRNMEVHVRTRPFVTFVLWTMIMIVSYRQLKELAR